MVDVQKLKSIIRRRSDTASPYIYVTKNQEIQGPYTPAEVRARILSAQYGSGDLGWYEGIADWRPLPDLLSTLPAVLARSKLTRRKSSGFARTSFYIGLFGMFLWLVLFLPIAATSKSGGGDATTLMLTVGVFMYGYMGANLLGIIFSFRAFTNRYSNKSMAIYGLLFNVIVFVLLAAILK